MLDSWHGVRWSVCTNHRSAVGSTRCWSEFSLPSENHSPAMGKIQATDLELGKPLTPTRGQNLGAKSGQQIWNSEIQTPTLKTKRTLKRERYLGNLCDFRVMFVCFSAVILKTN